MFNEDKAPFFIGFLTCLNSSNLVGAFKKSRSSERDFFIHCESNGISSCFSVYQNTFAMMIYNASH